jgi:lipoyl-dependent peroxiredoxin
MKITSATSSWEGKLVEGKGKFKLDSTGYESRYTFATRFENDKGTNPEELIAAAHSGCYSMALSGALGEKGFNPEWIKTTAHVKLSKGESGFFISEIELDTEAKVDGIDENTFLKVAEDTKMNCPVSKALASVNINLKAKLISRVTA